MTNSNQPKYRFLTKEATASVNGVFIIIVFISHLRTYMEVAPAIEKIMSLISQLMVTTFLFYSGYGVMESIRAKGMDYVKSIPKKRVLGVFAIFIPAVLLFAVMDLLLGIPFTIKQFALSLVAWLNLGNSNWYIFVIICLYILTWLSWIIADKITAKFDGPEKITLRNETGMTALFTSAILLIAVLLFTTPDYYYNTISAYLFGVFFSQNKDGILKFCGFNKDGKVEGILGVTRYIMTVLFCVLVTYLIRTYAVGQFKTPGFLVASVLFCLGIVLISYLIPFPDIVFRWFGEHLFEIYILMRIPMISLLFIPYLSKGGLTYAIICFILTILLAWIYHSIRLKISNYLKHRSAAKIAKSDQE